MVSKFEQERDRRGKLSDYLYGVSKLFVSGVGIGGLSPLITGQENGTQQLCMCHHGFLGSLWVCLLCQHYTEISN